MDGMVGIFILIGSLFVIFGLVFWSFIHMRHNLEIGKGLTDDMPPTIETYATLLDKNVIMEKDGSVKMPSHRISYLAKFRFDDGKETTMNIPQEIYDELPVGSRDILISQNGYFIDFGGRLGEDLIE